MLLKCLHNVLKDINLSSVKKIYLADLCHTAQGLVSEFIPYGIGCIKSFLIHHSRTPEQLDVRLFKYPNKFIAEVMKESPDIVGFSNYVWNLDLSYLIAKEIKQKIPNTLIVFGGPNYPLEDSERSTWLKNRPAIDIYITGEAESPFFNIAEKWIPSESKRDLIIQNVDGCHITNNGQLLKSNDVVPRLSDLNCFPSPYLEGYLDEFLREPKIIPMLQTNRGCPFTCTFCEKGARGWTKITKNDHSILRQELAYISKNTQSKVLVLADNNFGMYPQDLESAKILAEAKEKYDYPYYVNTSTGKNAGKRIFECAKILKDMLPITGSVQSLDGEVLKNIKRINLPIKELFELARFSAANKTSTRSEVILALPGDTIQKHLDTI